MRITPDKLLHGCSTSFRKLDSTSPVNEQRHGSLIVLVVLIESGAQVIRPKAVFDTHAELVGTITIRNTPTKNISLSVDWGTGGQPQKRATLTLDRVSNAEVKWSTFADSGI